MKKCKICNKVLTGKKYYKIRGGHICPDCYAVLPYGIKCSLSDFTKRQLKCIKSRLIPWDHSESPWFQYENLVICRTRVILNGICYPYTSLQSITLNFHPKELSGDHLAAGMISCVLEVNDPHIMIEELVSRDNVGYSITGQTIIYKYPDSLHEAIRRIQKVIEDHLYIIADAAAEDRQDNDDTS